MSSPLRERLYELLPAIYKSRDAAQGEPLRALLATFEAEAQRIQDDIAGLHQNWFIETCEDWVVPYLADLLGVRRLPAVGGPGFNQRTYVANTLSYRRRKGTYSLLGDLARDVTGWPVKVVELFRIVGATQHLDRLRPDNLRTPDLRDVRTLAQIGTPFNTVARSADVRRISEGVLRQNLPNVALFVWRLEACRIEDAPAAPQNPEHTRFTFSPLGDDIPLYNPVHDRGVRGEEQDLPGALRLETINARFFDGDPPAFAISFRKTAGELPTRVSPAEMVFVDLATWSAPDVAGKVVAVDPTLGRFAFLHDLKPTEARVSYSYGASGEVGAGPDDIVDRGPLDPVHDRAITLATLSSVLQAIPQGVPRVTLELRDNEVYAFDTDISLLAPPLRVPIPELEVRAANQRRPVIKIDLQTHPAPSRKITLGSTPLTLDGLYISGGTIEVVVPAGSTGSLTLRRCTLVPVTGMVSLMVSGGGALALTIERCITGALALRPAAPGAVTLSLADSIVHGAIDVATATILRSTVFDKASVDTLELASDTIFGAAVTVTFAQQGCLRYSYLPDNTSTTPPRFRCQPDLALSAAAAGEAPDRIRARIQPAFTSTRFGDPGYAQLRRDNDEQIRRGGSDGGEIGAFQFLHTVQREDNLRAGLEEYLRLGYEAGVFFVT